MRRLSGRSALLGPALVAAVPVVFGAVLVVWPLTAVLVRSLAGVGLAEMVDVLRAKAFGSVLWFTISQATLSTLLTLAIGLPIAHGLARYDLPAKSLIRALVVVPFVLPTVVVAAAFGAMFERLGLDLDRTVAAIIGAHVFFNLAVVVRIVGGFWAALDPRQIQAAKVLGASPIAAFWRVTLPQLRPVIAGAAVVVFLFSFTSFGVILILGGPTRATLETEIHRYAIFRQQFDVAAVLALVQLVTVVVLSVLAARFQRRHATTVARASQGTAMPIDSSLRRLNVAAVLVTIWVVIVTPIAALIERSLTVDGGYGFDHYRHLFERSRLLPAAPAEALARSLGFAVVAAAVAALVGLCAAWTIARGGRLGRFLEAVAFVPLGVSAVTLGFGYLVGFTLFDFRRSIALIPLAHAVIGLPFVLAAVVPAARAIDDRLRQAAATLGASPAQVWRRVDWPLLRQPLLTGAGFAAAVSLGEFGATSFLARGRNSFTAPLAIFRLLSRPGELLRGQAMALSVAIGIIVAVMAWFLERRRGSQVSAL